MHVTVTRTFLFTDLVGSTELLERLGDELGHAVRRLHFRLLREAVLAHGGQEVKSLGDGVMVAFPSAFDAIGCAVSMQQLVRDRGRGAGTAMMVRIGVHVGEAVLEEGDYFGIAVVVAKRICEAAEGGQVLTSERVRQLVPTHCGHAFKPMGDIALKGVTAPMAIGEVIWQPAAAEASAVSASEGERRTG